MPNSKKELSAFLAAATEEFLAKGGRIQVIPQGRRTL